MDMLVFNDAVVTDRKNCNTCASALCIFIIFFFINHIYKAELISEGFTNQKRDREKDTMTSKLDEVFVTNFTSALTPQLS